MGKIHSQGSWLIRVQGNERPPVHMHVLHPDGRAALSLYLNGTIINSNVPDAVISDASVWVAAHEAMIGAEWDRVGNPPSR